MSMIRINLLQVRQVKKRELGRQWIVLAAVVGVLVLVVNVLWWDVYQSESDKMAKSNDALKTQIAEKEKVLSDVNNINSKKKEVENKLAQLEDRRKSKSGPVRMLDALATATPKKVWLTAFKEASEDVELKGSAASLEDVAELMKNLQNIVWTPKGMGRLMEHRRDSKNLRVELLAYDGAMQDYAISDVKNFFTEVVMDNTSQAPASEATQGQAVVNFTIKFKAHYAI